MSDRSNIVYSYDGSFEGLMCCVFESFEKKELPSNILPPEGQCGLFDSPKWIETNSQKSERVFKAISIKISREAQELVKLGFLTCAQQKELLIFNFLRLGFKVGGQVVSMLTHDAVNSLQKAVRQLTFESHKLKGFVRFSIYNNALVAIIEPKNFVLPLLSSHFCDRYQNEMFMIYDKAHRMALIHKGRRTEIIAIDELILPEMEEEEAQYRRLWKQFYDTIAIESRMNPQCRMNFMPKRYWGNLTEFYEEKLASRSNNVQIESHEGRIIESNNRLIELSKD